MTQDQEEPSWKTYEEIAAFVLNQCAEDFGLSRFEGKQDVAGKSGTSWEIDARGWAEDNTAHFVVECKNYAKSAVSQDITGALVFRIQDTDAEGGFLVSPRGLQAGAKKVAAAHNIHEIKLDPRSTSAAYFGEWLGKLRVGINETIQLSERIVITRIYPDGTTEDAYDSAKDDTAG